MWTRLELSGWGRSSRATTLAARPTRIGEIEALLAETAAESHIAFGCGRSYGDVALNHDGRTILTTRLDRLLSFDPSSGELVCEPGVRFAELIEVFLPRGFAPPVTPGTAYVTLGGAIANDVHGKNHPTRGSFGDHVVWLELLSADGKRRRVSRERHAEIFRASLGGIGLTGIILALCLRLSPVASNAVELSERRVRDLDDFLAGFAEARQPYAVGWIDGLARGRQLGRGLLSLAVPAAHDVAPPRAGKLTLPVDLPALTLNPLSIAAFNALYLRHVPSGGRSRRVHFAPFSYPLDSLLQWNRMYGRRGFHQFQAVLPEAESETGLRRLLEEISAARAASFLSVLKRLGGEGEGYLSFPMAGYTLALDFPRRAGVEELLLRLEKITRAHGGRIYLAKDSCLSPEGFAEMYPRLPQFRRVLQELDPQGRMASDMARRLHIRDDLQGGKTA
jgi:decaprenylphospho-beta-D-ribofuranose 2-oxidase